MATLLPADPNAAKNSVAKAKQAAKKVKHERSDPNSKAGMKKETLLAITASKFDDFPTWYREVSEGAVRSSASWRTRVLTHARAVRWCPRQG